MNGPSDEFRTQIAEHVERVDSEAGLEELLAQIESKLEADVTLGVMGPPIDELAAIESWASLASYAAARFSAPASPWPRNLAGWGTRATKRLRSVANKLRASLGQVAQAAGAQSWSIGVSFPWGIQISLTWQ